MKDSEKQRTNEREKGSTERRRRGLPKESEKETAELSSAVLYAAWCGGGPQRCDARLLSCLQLTLSLMIIARSLAETGRK